MTFMRNSFTFLLSLLFLASLNSQKLVDAELITSLTRAEVSALAGGFPVQFDLDLYKVTYNTPDQNGNEHVASGLLCIPADESFAFPLACYQHGTVGGREDVPSRLAGGYQLPVIFAGIGYVVCAPDFVGLGDSPGIHPYVHADTEASAGVDMIRAVRELDADDDFGLFTLNDQVFVGGYSQGGHAAMALHRSLELDYPNEFNVVASAPMSGPYSISESMVDFTLGEDDYATVSYLAWLVLGYQAVYPELQAFSLEDVFKAEYIDDINAFANEEILLWELNARMTQILLDTEGRVQPRLMLQDDILNSLLTDPTHPFSVALADNDTYDWAPQAPTNLYYCQGDDQVTFQNAILADQVMKDNGATSVTAVQLDNQFAPLDHGQCVSPAATGVIFFFGSLQELMTNTQELLFDSEAKVYSSDTQLWVDVPQERNSNFFSMSIYDQTGRLIMEKEIQKGMSLHMIDVLSPGLYVVMLRDANSIFKTEKIIKH